MLLTHPEKHTVPPKGMATVTMAGNRAGLGCWLLLQWQMAISLPNTAISRRNHLVKSHSGAPLLQREEAWQIALRLFVKADAYRLSQALTTPEYLESWVTLPGDEPNSYLAGWKEADGFRLDHYQRGRRDLIIRCAFHRCRRRKMLFAFRVSGDLTPPESLVSIRLQGHFESTFLELHHSGISSASYYLWQQQMWQSSLARLTSLF
jgi:Activator of Hsp90 ATPase homolog 1-like protein